MAVVQSKAGGVLGTNKISETYTSNVTKGNTLVVMFTASRPLSSGDETSITDSLGTKYRITRQFDDSGNSFERLACAWGIAPSTGANTVSFSLDASPADGAVLLTELSGREQFVDGVRAKHNVAMQTGPSGANSVSPGAVTAQQGDDVIMGMFDVGALRTANYSAGTGFTELAEGGNPGGNILDAMIEAKENVTAGSITATAGSTNADRVISFVISVAAAVTRTSYTTTFSGADENPLSENGEWFGGATVGVDWGDVKIVSNKAVGTLASTFHDNTQILRGIWPADQRGIVTAYRGTPGSSSPEIEIRLRSTMFPNSIRGYEVGFSLNAGAASYIIIVRWNGPAGNFDYLFQQTGSQFQVVDGDVLTAQIVGNVITAYINGVQKATANIVTDIPVGSNGGSTVYTDGNPGIGINADTGGTASLPQYGFKAFTGEQVAASVTQNPSGFLLSTTLGTPAVQSSIITLNPTGFGLTAALGTPTITTTAANTQTPVGFGLVMGLGTFTTQADVQVTGNFGFGLSAVLGTPAVQITGGNVQAPTGFNLTAALGTPAVQLGGSVSPTGFGLTASLGTPAVTISGPSLAVTGFQLIIGLGAAVVTGANASKKKPKFPPRIRRTMY